MQIATILQDDRVSHLSQYCTARHRIHWSISIGQHAPQIPLVRYSHIAQQVSIIGDSTYEALKHHHRLHVQSDKRA